MIYRVGLQRLVSHILGPISAALIIICNKEIFTMNQDSGVCGPSVDEIYQEWIYILPQMTLKIISNDFLNNFQKFFRIWNNSQCEDRISLATVLFEIVDGDNCGDAVMMVLVVGLVKMVVLVVMISRTRMMVVVTWPGGEQYSHLVPFELSYLPYSV